jgi:DNA (cytosine-5)-methyltransferase 1
LTVHDAISDLPKEAFVPQDTGKWIDYPNTDRTEYQVRMKGCSEKLWNHAAKRHMLRRLIRTALIEQGDYGTVVRDRLFEKGVPEEIITHVLEGTFTEDELRTIRDVDKGIERQILNTLKTGQVSVDEISGNIHSKGFANKYRRLHWDDPSHTLVAHMARDCSDFIHPELNRPITVREAARLQSFPDSFRFYSSHFRQLRGIGNAVPPLLAQVIADHLSTELKYRKR